MSGDGLWVLRLHEKRLLIGLVSHTASIIALRLASIAALGIARVIEAFGAE